ncbi:MlaA family lipoprotein [Oceanobacter mangrovi]|uniref:MlaA family lipoprotein n=1 Tax=Oceanobacter mangrovi TaxID=2862510 RepID=UPI001C8E631D|nr:VacJ family lipoprotein [Oceanobacter mangrovi]
MMRLLLTALLTLASSMALAEQQKEYNPDPWEGFNRRMFAFNEVMDKYVLKPAAKGYQYITPQDVDDSVSNFFSNLGDVLVVVNDIGQLKFGQAASDTGRFLINSTVGFFGVFDVATHIGLRKHEEDFGQTLGYWGVGTGPYLVLPFLGPSTLRDGAGTTLEWYSGLSGTAVADNTAREWGMVGIWGVDKRADLLSAESMITGDKYTFLRSLYLQRREYLVNDGKVEASFDDDWDSFDDSSEEDDWGDDWDKGMFEDGKPEGTGGAAGEQSGGDTYSM